MKIDETRKKIRTRRIELDSQRQMKRDILAVFAPVLRSKLLRDSLPPRSVRNVLGSLEV